MGQSEDGSPVRITLDTEYVSTYYVGMNLTLSIDDRLVKTREETSRGDGKEPQRTGPRLPPLGHRRGGRGRLRARVEGPLCSRRWRPAAIGGSTETISMPGRSFLDANVLVYTDDAGSPEKQAAAVDLVARCRRSREGVVSTQVLQEYFVAATQEARESIRRWRAGKSSSSANSNWSPPRSTTCWGPSISAGCTAFTSGTHSSFARRSRPAARACCRKTCSMDGASTASRSSTLFWPRHRSRSDDPTWTGLWRRR